MYSKKGFIPEEEGRLFALLMTYGDLYDEDRPETAVSTKWNDTVECFTIEKVVSIL